MAGQVIHPIDKSSDASCVMRIRWSIIYNVAKVKLSRRYHNMKRIAAMTLAVLAFSAVAANAADSTTINGYISDSMCGAKHAGSGAECVKKCISGGMSPVFVDEAKKQVWTIDNPDAVKSYYGDHVTIKATADADKKSVHIDSIAAAK
jgi:hypothetical protein